MSDREQAIKDVADALAYTVKLGDDDALSCSMGYAALQRERVIALERALQLIEHKSDQMLQGQYSMKILGGLILATARAALNGDSK